MTSSLIYRGASSSSSSTRQTTHDVFLSFSSEDTRRNFTAHLYEALDRNGINTYIDDDQLESGENIPRAPFKFIEGSKISVIILSPKYTSSTWCLDQLTKILECKATKGQIVLPMFYDVDLSDVGKQISSFEKAFGKHKDRFKNNQEKLQRWKAALTEIGNLSGLRLRDYRDEAQCVDEIVEKITNHIKATKQVAKHPIAITSPLHVPDSSSSPAQVPDSSSSPSPVGIESPAQVPDSSSSPSPVGIQALVQAPNWSSSPSGNGEQGSNPSISSDGVIVGLNGLVFATHQIGGFKTHPVNMWITLFASVMFCLSWATMKKIDGTHWAKYSRINNSFRILFGTLGPVSLSSIPLPHRVWWLFFFIWAVVAVVGFIYVAYKWIKSGADGRDDVENGQMIPLNRPTNSLTPFENSSDAAHS